LGCRRRADAVPALLLESVGVAGNWSVPQAPQPHWAASRTVVVFFHPLHVERERCTHARRGRAPCCTRCVLCRPNGRVQKYRHLLKSFSTWLLTLSHPLRSQDYPKLTHTSVPHIACACCFGGSGCHLHCQRCPCSSAGCVVSAARLLTRTSWDHPAASREKQMGGRYCLVPSVRPSRLPQPHGPRSHGPLRCRETPRFVPAPPVAACARGGAACGVARLEQCDRRRA
jgi:hypothetical protein